MSKLDTCGAFGTDEVDGSKIKQNALNTDPVSSEYLNPSSSAFAVAQCHLAGLNPNHTDHYFPDKKDEIIQNGEESVDAFIRGEFSRHCPREAEHQPLALIREEEEHARLDIASIEFQHGRRLNDFIYHIIGDVVHSTRKAYEARIDRDISAKWNYRCDAMLQKKSQAMTKRIQDQLYHTWKAETLAKLEQKYESVYQRKMTEKMDAEYEAYEKSAKALHKVRFNTEILPRWRHIIRTQCIDEIKQDLIEKLTPGIVELLRVQYRAKSRMM